MVDTLRFYRQIKYKGENTMTDSVSGANQNNYNAVINQKIELANRLGRKVEKQVKGHNFGGAIETARTIKGFDVHQVTGPVYRILQGLLEAINTNKEGSARAQRIGILADKAFAIVKGKINFADREHKALKDLYETVKAKVGDQLKSGEAMLEEMLERKDISLTDIFESILTSPGLRKEFIDTIQTNM